MTSSSMKLLSDFANSSPMSYCRRIGGQLVPSLLSVTSLFENRKIIQGSPSKTYHSTLIHSNITPLTPTSCTHHSKRYSTSIVPGNNLSASRFLLILMLITAVGVTLSNEVHAAENSVDPDRQLEMASFLLEKKPDQRTIEERIKLFNTLLSIGTDQAKKAKKKNIILVFGNTGAGKSTLINFIYGCNMAKDADGSIIVDPNSDEKEVAKIGTGSHSCTFIPQEIPGINFPITIDTSEESLSSQPRETSITCFDMPGLSDDRGIEVALANAVIMQRVTENAQSVKLVMVFEESQLTAEKGIAWKKAVKLLFERFNGNIGDEEKSLSLVITKGSNDPAIIQNKIKKFNPKGYFDLSNHVMVYDPLNTKSRKNLLDRLYQTQSYKSLGANIALGGDQLWDALKLGEQIQQEIEKDLNESGGVGINKAITKIKFTHGIQKLQGKCGDQDLKKPHEAAKKAVEKHASNIIEKIRPAKEDPSIKNQIAAYKKYQKFKGNFDPLVDFETLDEQVEKIKNNTPDPRTVAWDQPQMSVASGIVTVAATAGAVAAVIIAPPVVAVASIAAAAAAFSGTIYTLKQWSYPSDDQKDLSEFCQKSRYST